MDPILITLAIRAAIRLGKVGSDAFGQYARDRDVLLPSVIKVEIPLAEKIDFDFHQHPEWVTKDVKPYLDSFLVRFRAGQEPLPKDMDVLSAERARGHLTLLPELKGRSDEAAGYWMIAQWGKKGPTGPITRVILTMADVALEFAAQDPSLFGVSGKGEGLVKALAQNLTELVPDDGNLGPRNEFGVRLAEIFLRAGLKTVSDHPDMLISDTHVQLFVKNTLPKLLEALPPNLDTIQWRGAVETLLGPVASAALQTLGEHPDAFFGDKFNDKTLLGALTSTFLITVAKTGLKDSLTEAGAVALYKSTLGLVAARPELFVGATKDDNDKFVSTLLTDVATILKDSSPPFDMPLVVKLAGTTIDALGTRAAGLLDPGQPWQNVLSQTLVPILNTVKKTIATGNTGALKQLATTDFLDDLVAIVLKQAAKTPGMILKTDNKELERVVVAIATAMAQDVNLLLSGEDWLSIAAVAAEEAAVNPGRLFGFKTGAAATTDVATPLITGLLKVASAQWTTHGRDGGAVLFGSTLADAIAITLRTAASNAAAAFTNTKKVDDLALALGNLIAANPGRYGYRECLKLYAALLPGAIATGDFGQIDDATIKAILSGESK